MFDESNEEQLLPILFDVPAEGRGEFMTTAQISERLITYGNIKKNNATQPLGSIAGDSWIPKKGHWQTASSRMACISA